MSVILKGGASANLADVTAANELKVALGANPATTGYVKMATTGHGAPLISTVDGHLVTSSTDQMMFYDQVDGTSVNTNLWAQTSTTMTIAQAGGLLTLNNSSLTTASTAAQVTSIRQIPLYGSMPILLNIGAIVNNAAQANSVMEMGFGFAAGVAAPTDGVYFRWNASGELRGVINYGGVETISEAITSPTINELHTYMILIDNGVVGFVVDQTMIVLPFPEAQPFPTSGGRQPVFARVYNTASVPSVAPRLQLGRVIAIQGVLTMDRPWNYTLASLGRGSYQSPTAFSQTANHANSTSPVSATLSNTAAGYTTLGGKWQFAAVAGAATDFALFGFQVPTGFQLVVNQVSISAMVTGAAIATTTTVLDWSLGVNASAVSLATGDAATTWSPRRIPLGMQGFPLSAPTGPAGIGDMANDIVRDFHTPLIVDSGRFFHVIVQVPVGTATASQVFRGTVTVNGYYE